MHRISRPFARSKPTFRCQKNEDQDDHAQQIPLPGVSRVVPEEDLLQCGSQASHVFNLASKQPQDSWLAGRLIVNGLGRECKLSISDCRSEKTNRPPCVKLALGNRKSATPTVELRARSRQCGRRASARYAYTSPPPRDCE